MSSIEQENIENEFKLIIRKNFIETDKNIEMDLKNYSSDKDLLEYFFEKINLCSSENFEKIFSSYEDKEKDFIEIISSFNRIRSNCKNTLPIFRSFL